MPAPALVALLLAVGLAEPQARAIVVYSASQSGAELDPCATSSLGDGLFGLTQGLRRDLHREAGTAGCIAPELQVRFLAHAWPSHYPACAARFAAGDLRAFRRCFGLGEGD
jgi:hypothetical protein